jgi:hypothetical protein
MTNEIKQNTNQWMNSKKNQIAEWNGTKQDLRMEFNKDTEIP